MSSLLVWSRDLRKRQAERKVATSAQTFPHFVAAVQVVVVQVLVNVFSSEVILIP